MYSAIMGFSALALKSIVLTLRKKDAHVEEKVCHLSLFAYLFDNLKFLGILESSSPGRTK